jgi:hypothetical protein
MSNGWVTTLIAERLEVQGVSLLLGQSAEAFERRLMVLGSG